MKTAFTIHVNDEGFEIRLYTGLFFQVMLKKEKKIPIKKEAKDLNRQFTEDR